MTNVPQKLDTCRICQNSHNNEKYLAKEMMFGLRHEFEYFQCSVCECLQIGSIPKNMSPYYPEQYYSFDNYDGRKFKGVKGKIRRWKYRALINHSSRFHKLIRFVTGKKDYDLFKGLKLDKNSRILDVGCGNGQNFLYPLAENGFQNLLGCDPYLEQSISYSNGLKIENSSVHDITGVWDVITFHHSFEHIPDPIENLKSVFDLLAPDGVCIIRIPTASSFAWEHYKTNWVQLDAPRHFYVHSLKSMQTLAAMTGLDHYKVAYDSTHFQFTGSEKYVEDVSLFELKSMGIIKKIQESFKKRRYKQRAKRLNFQERGDQAAFYFRRAKV